MTAQSGASFLLQISHGATPPAWQTVAGMRATKLAISGQAVAITNSASGGWRALLSGGGARSVTIGATGIFQGSAAEAQILGRALAGTLDRYQLIFADGHTLAGPFLVTRLDYTGDYNNERSYALTLESAGVLVWT